METHVQHVVNFNTPGTTYIILPNHIIGSIAFTEREKGKQLAYM